jgi:hypothetical protein
LPSIWFAWRSETNTTPRISFHQDFTPAVKAVVEKGKKVFAASATPGAQLAQAVYKFIPLQRSWFDDCFGE